MSKEKIEINVAEGVKELIIREGEALPLKEPTQVKIAGTITAPAEFLSKRTEEVVKPKQSNVVFSYEGMYIVLTVNESDGIPTIITGKLQPNPELKKFGINEGKKFTIKDLKQFLKMNRYFFSDQDENIKIIGNLEKFRASVNSQIEQESSNQGNKKQHYEVKVDSNLDLNFTLNMPVFVGQPNSKFQVEICFDVRDQSIEIWLESAELQQIILSGRQVIIDKALESFKEKFVVIEQ